MSKQVSCTFNRILNRIFTHTVTSSRIIRHYGETPCLDYRSQNVRGIRKPHWLILVGMSPSYTATASERVGLRSVTRCTTLLCSYSDNVRFVLDVSSLV